MIFICFIFQLFDGVDKRLIARNDNQSRIQENIKYMSSTNKIEIKFISDFAVRKKGFFAVVTHAPGSFANVLLSISNVNLVLQISLA